MIDLDFLEKRVSQLDFSDAEFCAWDIFDLIKEIRAARECIADLRCLVDRDMIGLAEKYITEFDKARRG